ncbi:Rossmann-like and DUF2520 domain-containing protein [Psychroflexus sediminis]|uniref:Predicted oxidoreductase, contains short-chain dehydrogenase (SDR) and DUF2520 domains n=1 Tax=Psychroflexus sediminis TaxID=470826 RepID=A0A1G7V2W5_9FLAO|nr:DUF2520 domain-containing protein [Psychroflexus sediminis]SDG54123.1 Predicted oxidoreductase, contains short-chain dehydrogenase (SDR) and DUF2520 domains [Psychroflexus sediminis]
MFSIVILGTGNVATHMFQALRETQKCAVIQVYNHQPESLKAFEEFTATTTDLSELMEADLYLLCLKDDVIKATAEQIQTKTGVIAHTSGSQPILEASNSGVFYPLQTFSKGTKLDYSKIPFCLEANSKDHEELLKSIASSISTEVFKISSAQRQTLHLAAVFVCNFTNHLYAIGETICKEDNMPFDILKALIQETSAKVQKNSPSEVQTGPAIRKDESSIKKHMSQLRHQSHLEIYRLLTQSILKKHDKL